MKKAWYIQLQLLHVELNIHIQIRRCPVRINWMGNLNDTATPGSEGGQKVWRSHF